jgi:phenylalanyl-tRNA synthetase beta chain
LSKIKAKEVPHRNALIYLDLQYITVHEIRQSALAKGHIAGGNLCLSILIGEDIINTMLAPYEWIKELVDISATPEEAAAKLTMIGLEVEGTKPVKDDFIFEVNVTPNRPDCLSILGIARELSAAFRTSLIIPPHDIAGEQPASDFSIEILNPELCNRYTGRLIRGIRISDSPGWIRIRLEKCGIRSINNIVDITNYVLLEFGHPLHAFDADKIEGKEIKVSKAGKDGKIVTLDGVERELSEDALLIWDGMEPIAIAGVMGGLNTEVSDGTKNVFLESAYFDPLSVRKTSKRLNLVSESSYRFERGADIEFLDKALDRAAHMIREVAGGTIFEIIDAYPVKYMPEPVEVNIERINRILGAALSRNEMIDIMERLGIRAEGGNRIIVFPPANRRDIKRDSDVAEEIARIHGYDKIPTTIPRSPLSSGRPNRRSLNINKIRDGMRKSGFTEVINYSFMSKSDLDMLGIPDTDRKNRTVEISNPLNQDEGLLRTTLVHTLLRNLKYNLDRGMKDVRLFEISKVFEDIDQSLPQEELKLGGIFYKEKAPSLWKEEAGGFYIVKGALEALFEEVKIKGYSFSPSSETFLHGGRSADIHVSDHYLGYLGVMAPEIVEKLDLKKEKPEIVLFELGLDMLFHVIPDSLRYSPVPRYPSVERDIAVVVDESIPSSRITEIINGFRSELIEQVSVFDYFKGANIPDGKKSLAYSIVYRSNERTLREEEVERLHSSLVDYIVEKTGGELRK